MSETREGGWLHATAFEFRHRFLIISGFYAVGFGLLFFERLTAGEALLRVWVRDPTKGQLQAVFGAGSFLVALAASIRTWASAYLPSAVVHDIELHDERLVADGPYRFVRNPLYLGNLVMSLGMGLLASRLGYPLLVLGQAIFYRRVIGREEKELSASQGESYQRFLAAVPRLFPALSPRMPASGKQPVWPQALLGEAFFWIFAFAEAAFAWTLDLRVFGAFLAGGFAIYYLSVWIQRPEAQRG